MPKDNTLENYPGLAEQEARLKRVKRELKRLAKWPQEDLLELYKALIPKPTIEPTPDVQPPA